MDAPKAPAIPGYDVAAAATIVSAALAQRGGAALVVDSLGGLPGVVFTPARTGLFRPGPAVVLLGAWRYDARADRLGAAHVVGGITIASDALAPPAAGPHVAGALGVFVAEQGIHSLPDVLALLEGLAVAAG